MCAPNAELLCEVQYHIAQDDRLYSRCVVLEMICEQLSAYWIYFLLRKKNLSTQSNEEKKLKSNRM